jgi:hypothetical protein
MDVAARILSAYMIDPFLCDKRLQLGGRLRTKFTIQSVDLIFDLALALLL